MNTSIDALEQVSVTVGDLVNLTQILQMQLDNITSQTVALSMSCTGSGINATICSAIPTTNYTVVVDYTAVSVLVLVYYNNIIYYVCVMYSV